MSRRENLDRPVDGVVLHEGGEALVEPEVAPPVHGHQVTEPLVGNLVGHDCRHRLHDQVQVQVKVPLKAQYLQLCLTGGSLVH